MRLTVGRKIILGLAAVVAMGTASMLVVYQGLRTLQTSVHKLAETEEPTVAAAYEMEINVIGVGHGVLRYLDNRDPKDRDRVRTDQRDFKQFHAQYVRLAKNDRARGFGDRIARMYGEFEALGEELMAARDAEGTLFSTVTRDLEQIDDIVDDQLQASASLERGDRGNLREALVDLEADIAEVSSWLANYRRTHREEDLEFLWRNVREASDTLTRLKAESGMNSAERRAVGTVDRLFTQTASRTQEALAIDERIRDGSRRLAVLQLEMDDLLDDQIQIAALQDLYAPRQEADRGTAAVIRLTGILTPLFLLSAVAVALLLTWSITQSVRRLMTGTAAIGRGDLSYRIALKGRDELAELAQQFNRMVVELEATTVSKSALEASEAKLHATNADLRQQIAERERAQDEQARLQMELRRNEVMAAMGSIVAGVSHEVRNPLFGISAVVDALEARFVRFGAQAEYQRHLTVLRGELNRLTRLMQELLEYGKPGAMELAPGSIATEIAEAIHACAPLAERLRVRVTSRVGVDIAAVRMDRARLTQVFQNLLENALQHSPPETAVIIEVGADPAESGWIACAIKDAGPGFQPEDLPRIFEPFFTRRRGGTGLGLSIVQRIVEGHGGKISVANRSEGGAVVTVRLPAVDPAVAQTPREVVCVEQNSAG